MPFCLKNSPATFQRLVNKVISGLDGVEAYIDDVIMYRNIYVLFDLSSTDFQLTINLNKSEFCHGTLIILGHIVGQG